jgi:hypothetical protein
MTKNSLSYIPYKGIVSLIYLEKKVKIKKISLTLLLNQKIKIKRKKIEKS